jgi:hypothetical protein
MLAIMDMESFGTATIRTRLEGESPTCAIEEESHDQSARTRTFIPPRDVSTPDLAAPPSTAPVRLGRGRPRKAPTPSATPSSTAPIVLDDDKAEPPLLYSTAHAVPCGVRSKWDVGTDEELGALSSTELALRRGAGGEEDLYDPGTLRERVYMRSLSIYALNDAAVDSLDDEVVDKDGFIDIDGLVPDSPKTQDIFEWELY